MRKFSFIIILFFLGSFLGCETVHEGTKAVGSVVGEGANAVGGISEGGAEAIQKPVTDAENPFGR